MEKIKNFFDFVKRAWLAGPNGKIGLLFLILAVFFFVRLFFGTQNIQGYVVTLTNLNQDRKELAILQKNLKQIQHHVYLLEHANSAPDYIEELGLKTLNLGNPEFKELKY